MKQIFIALALLFCYSVGYSQSKPLIGNPTDTSWFKGSVLIDKDLKVRTLANDAENSYILSTDSYGKIILYNKNNIAVTVEAGYGVVKSGDTIGVDTAVIASRDYVDANFNLQKVLENGNVADTGIHIIDYINNDPISGVSKYSEFVARILHTDPTEPVVTMQLNDKFQADTTMSVPIYSIAATPIFSIEDSLYSGIRYGGITSNLNLDSAHSKGFFNVAWMFQSGGHFGYPGSRVKHYAGYVAHNPVNWDTCDYCYGIKVGGFNSPNYKNSAMLALGFVSQTFNGNWGIYMSQHVLMNNYLGSRRTMIGLPTSVEIDSTATLQTTTFASTGLAKYTSNISGSMTSLSLTPRVYVDSINNTKLSSSDTISRLIPTKKFIDSSLSLYLLANGITTDANGLITLPAAGGTNGGIKINGPLYLQTKDTQATSNGTMRVGLSGYYTNTTGNRSIIQSFGTFAPTSGSASFSAYSSNVGINQTGTATGITSSFLASASITAAADYRAYRATNTSGVAFYNENSGARNIFLGEMQVGSSTDLGAYPLQVTGNVYLNGSVTNAVSSGVAFNQSNAAATNNFEGSTSFTTGLIAGNVFQNSISKTNRFRGITTFDTTIEIKYIPTYSVGGYVALVRNVTTDSIESVSLSTVATTGSFADLSGKPTTLSGYGITDAAPSASGTYTPTLTGVTNITASTAYVTGYYRIGNTITVFGKVDINATLAASSATELGVSLPVASDLTGEEDLGGTAASDAIASLVVRIKGDAASNRASFVFKSISITNDSYNFEFSYQVK